MLLLGAGQLWLIALVQALPTELRWTFVVGGDWLPPPPNLQVFPQKSKLL